MTDGRREFISAEALGRLTDLNNIADPIALSSTPIYPEISSTAERVTEWRIWRVINGSLQLVPHDTKIEAQNPTYQSVKFINLLQES